MNDFVISIISVTVGAILGFLLSLISQSIIYKRENKRSIETIWIQFREARIMAIESNLSNPVDFAKTINNILETSKRSYTFYAILKIKLDISNELNNEYMNSNNKLNKIMNDYMRGFNQSQVKELYSFIQEYSEIGKKIDKLVESKIK